MIACAKLYAHAIVVAVWWLVWTAGARTDQVVGAGLALTAVACVISMRQARTMRTSRRDSPPRD
jgi:hypothetical protein